MSYPFGDGLSCTGGPDATEHHFTGKERDTETGLDYFFARYFTSDLARFMTPDWADAPATVPYAHYGDPQTLNLYAYVGNNPNTGIDLDGHFDNNNPVSNNPGFENNVGPGGVESTPPEPGQVDNSGSSTADPSGATTDSGQQKGDPPKPSNPEPKDPVAKQKTKKKETHKATVAGILAPAADAAAQAAKQAAKGMPKATPTPIPRPVPGPDPVPPQLAPGEIPEIEPDASNWQKFGVIVLNAVKGFGQNVTDVIVCVTCNSDEGRKAMGFPVGGSS